MTSLAGLRKEALDLHKVRKFDGAIKAYRRCLSLVPEDQGLWLNLGAALRASNFHEAAVGCYRRALELKPEDAGALSNLGNVLKDMGRLEEALACHHRAVTLQPDNRQFLFNYAIALREALRFDQALQYLDSLLAQDPQNAAYQWERALVHLYLGHYAAGWQDYEARFRTGELRWRNFGCPAWRGENLQGKKLLVVAEQGYGDTILAARFIPQLIQQGATIIFECKPELQPVLSGLTVQQFVDPRAAKYPAGDFDFYCHIMSLMGLLNIEGHNIALPVAITVPEASRKKMAFMEKIGKGRKKIGIVWSGSLTFKDNARRSCALQSFLRLAEIPGLQLFSLQKGEKVIDLDRSGATSLVIDLSPHLSDFGDTAAAIEQLDMIVMTDSSVAHLAASMNKPVINLLQYKPYWIYPQGESTPWYPSMQLIQQESPGDWEGVFNTLESSLVASLP